MPRDIIILDCPEIKCPKVLTFVFVELCKAFVDISYNVKIINNMNQITNNSIVFMGDGFTVHNPASMLNAIAPLAKILFNTVDKAVADKDLAAKLKSELQTQMLQSHTAELQAASRVIEAEAKAGWFTASWRPLLMYVLIVMLVWNYIFSPIIFVLFNVKASVDLPSEIVNLLTVGVGGYTIGRSAESVAKSFASRPVNKDQENG